MINLQHTENINVCTHYFNGSCLPMEVKTKDGKIHRLEPHKDIETTKDNHITHSRYLLDSKAKFIKIKLDKIREYQHFIA